MGAASLLELVLVLDSEPAGLRSSHRIDWASLRAVIGFGGARFQRTRPQGGSSAPPDASVAAADPGSSRSSGRGP